MVEVSSHGIFLGYDDRLSKPNLQISHYHRCGKLHCVGIHGINGIYLRRQIHEVIKTAPMSALRFINNKLSLLEGTEGSTPKRSPVEIHKTKLTTIHRSTS